MSNIEFGTLTHEDIIRLVDRKLHHHKVQPEEYLRHWLFVSRHFAYTDQDDSWDEFERNFAIIIAKLVAAEKEIAVIRENEWHTKVERDLND